jgi:hypothetical protein
MIYFIITNHHVCCCWYHKNVDELLEDALAISEIGLRIRIHVSVRATKESSCEQKARVPFDDVSQCGTWNIVFFLSPPACQSLYCSACQKQTHLLRPLLPFRLHYTFAYQSVTIS